MEAVLVNGIRASTGLPLLAGLTLDDIAKVAMGQKIDPASLAELYRQSRRKGRGQTRSPVEGVDASKLAEAGWGVVFAPDSDAEREALEPLLSLRREQAGDRYREFFGADAFRTGETKRTFLENRGAASTGPVEPKKIPFYLMLVGSPEAIPFEVQYELDVQYAVGRIHFDTLAEYGLYAAAVVAAEKGDVALEPRAAFVGVKNSFDDATLITANYLVKPLAKFLAGDQKDWRVESLMNEGAHKKDLLDLLSGSKQPPALLFTASHGLGYDCGDSLQHGYQGALVMQDYEMGNGSPSLDQCFTADDVGSLNTAGMIAFHFACFGAGTPDKNAFYGYAQGQAGMERESAQRPFLSALPKRMLANGALAVVGHVDFAFTTTFRAGASTAVFESALKSLAEGGRIGLAMDFFNLRHAELSVALTVTIDEEQRTKPAAREDLAQRWLQNNDARNYVVVGDPAVKLPLAESPAVETERLTRQVADLEGELGRLKERLRKLSA